MSKPLLDEGATELEALLLRAGRDDAPPDPHARSRTIANIKSAVGAAGIAGGGILGVRWLTGSSAVTKWVVVVSVAATAGGVYVAASRASARVASVPPVTATVPVRSAGPPDVTPPEPPRAPEAPVPAAPVLKDPIDHDSRHAPKRVVPQGPRASIKEANLPATSPVPATSPAQPEGAVQAPPTTLREETAELNAARRLVETSRGREALAVLDRYDARFKSGFLAEEAAVLRVEALLAVGDVPQARRIVSSFEARYPASSYRGRVRAMVEQKE